MQHDRARHAHANRSVYTFTSCRARLVAAGAAQSDAVYFRMSTGNAQVVTARLSEEEGRMFFEMLRPNEKPGTAVRRLVREAYERQKVRP